MQNRQRLQLVQASRAIVPILVILFHTSFVSSQYFNVDLFGLTKLDRIGGADYFFVLTGFMMFYVYGKDFGKKEKFRPFLWKRFSRLIPYYWLITLAVIIFFFFVPIGYGYDKNIQTILNSLFLTQMPYPIIYSAWSLRNNILFYVFFSLLILSNGKFVKSILVLWISSILFFLVTSTHFSNGLLASLFNNVNLDFVLGALIAYYVQHAKVKHGITFIVIGTLGYVYTWLSGVNDWWRIDDSILYGIFASFLLLGIVSIEMNHKIQISRIFDYLGNASFSIYLVHPPFLGFAAAMTVKLGIFNAIGSVGSIVLCIAFVTTLGCLAHSFIEKPLTSALKNIRFSPSRVPMPIRLIRGTSAK